MRYQEQMHLSKQIHVSADTHRRQCSFCPCELGEWFIFVALKHNNNNNRTYVSILLPYFQSSYNSASNKHFCFKLGTRPYTLLKNKNQKKSSKPRKLCAKGWGAALPEQLCLMCTWRIRAGSVLTHLTRNQWHPELRLYNHSIRNHTFPSCKRSRYKRICGLNLVWRVLDRTFFPPLWKILKLSNLVNYLGLETAEKDLLKLFSRF